MNGLLNILKKEQKTGEIAPLQKDFYIGANNRLDSVKKTSLDEYRNMSKLLMALKERRSQQKRKS